MQLKVVANIQRCSICWIIALTVGVVQAAQPLEAGFQIERFIDSGRERPILIDWWYPTQNEVASSFNYGLGTGRVAEAGTIVAGKLPLILLSHGALGAARNYSWIAEHLARNGYLVAGVSHYGESYVYGADSIDPGAVIRPWERPLDISAALTFITTESALAASVDASRIGFIGHSSGGATALFLAGAIFSEERIASYCSSPRSLGDRGCSYADNLPAPKLPSTPSPSTRPSVYEPQVPDRYTDRRIGAFIVLDPALGPGFSDFTRVPASLPMLIVGSVNNDFLPFTHHAERIARELPAAQTLWLANNEGHFVYLNECAADLEAQGVALCVDREGVSRGVVHEQLGATIYEYLEHY